MDCNARRETGWEQRPAAQIVDVSQQSGVRMNEPIAICTIAIIVLTSVSSLAGFRDTSFRERYLFSIHEILVEKQYYRLFTNGFLHADWNHLLLNMVSLYLFGRHVESFLGVGQFLLIYITAIAGGSLLSLWIHRHHEYHAYGASGGVCGMIFSYIFLFPGSGIILFPLPISIPAWLYVILFIAGSFIALKRQTDNIGHDAHLGGAIIGLWTTAALEPWIVRSQPKLFLGISGLSVLLFAYLVKNPLFLPLSSFRFTWSRRPSSSKQSIDTPDVDSILEKISAHGIDSLSDAEKSALTSVSRKYRQRANSRKANDK